MRDFEPHDAQKKTGRVSKETWPSLSIITHLGLKTRLVAPFQTPLLQCLDDDFNDLARSPRRMTSLHLSSPDSPFRASHRMAVLSLTDVMTSTSVEGLLVLPFFFDGINLKFLKDSRLRNLLIVDVWFVFAFRAAQISLWQALFFVPYRYLTTKLQLQNKNWESSHTMLFWSSQALDASGEKRACLTHSWCLVKWASRTRCCPVRTSSIKQTVSKLQALEYPVTSGLEA